VPAIVRSAIVALSFELSTTDWVRVVMRSVFSRCAVVAASVAFWMTPATVVAVVSAALWAWTIALRACSLLREVK
jgi:hypothetical protein